MRIIKKDRHKKMTTHLSAEFDSKSIDFDMNANKVSSNEKSKKNFLTKKRSQNKEYIHIQKRIDETKKGNIFENMDEKNDCINNFLSLQEVSISSEDEKNIGIDKFYFLEELKKDENLFKVYYPGHYLFTETKEDLLQDYLKGNNFSLIKRSVKRLPNYKQKHYIRVNIKRTFMNKYLLKALNKILKKYEYITLFSKFPQSFVINVAKNLNKTLMNMRLKEIFRAEELYEDIDNTNYKHNLKIVDEIEKKGNPELNMILNRKFRCLFEEYLNSEEFGKIELNKIKNKKDEYYIKKYVYLAKQFIEFLFSIEQ